MPVIDMDELQKWRGKSRQSVDTIHPGPVAALSAALDHETVQAGVGEKLPPCWHWLYFHEHVSAAGTGEDGHPRRGGFLPPVPLPRRMWAGGQVNFLSPVRIGDELRRTSTIGEIACKSGRSGDLVFVTVNHQYQCGERLCIVERQDLVYRDADGAARPVPVAGQLETAELSRQVAPDPVLLFRYSALTYNSHRIHYDREYATQVEGYPELVVQGPLTATLLLDALGRLLPDANIGSFSFRGRRPLYCGSPVTLALSPSEQAVQLAAYGEDGAVAMQAEATLQVSL